MGQKLLRGNPFLAEFRMAQWEAPPTTLSPRPRAGPIRLVSSETFATDCRLSVEEKHVALKTVLCESEKSIYPL